MNKSSFQILPANLLSAYKEQVKTAQLGRYKALEESELSAEHCSFYTPAAAAFWSKIAREDVELDAYVKHKRFGFEFLPDYTRKIDDLYEAYQFAKSNTCKHENIEEAHRIITKNILPEHRRGKLRTGKMYVTTEDGKIEYVAASPFALLTELEKFYADLALLSKATLAVEEAFFYAALLHLVFVKIHPFDEGNGRTVRLIEKWFLAEKLGAKAWLIQSEKNYYRHHQIYYQNIRLLGLEYENLNYEKALPFLFMLPASLDL